MKGLGGAAIVGRDGKGKSQEVQQLTGLWLADFLDTFSVASKPLILGPRSLPPTPFPRFGQAFKDCPCIRYY